MKTLVLTMSLFVGTSTLFAQTDAPLYLRLSPNMVQATNDSTKEVVFTSVKVRSSKGYDINNNQDFYFHKGIQPTELADVVHNFPDDEDQPFSNARLTFVQFADGTTWGEAPDSAKEVMDNRKPLLAFFEGALAAYANGGEEDFLKYLNSETLQARAARQFLRLQKGAGTEVAIAKLKDLVDCAKTHWQA